MVRGSTTEALTLILNNLGTPYTYFYGAYDHQAILHYQLPAYTTNISIRGNSYYVATGKAYVILRSNKPTFEIDTIPNSSTDRPPIQRITSSNWNTAITNPVVQTTGTFPLHSQLETKTIAIPLANQSQDLDLYITELPHGASLYVDNITITHLI